MVNKKIWFGILVIVLVFGMTIVGCVSSPNFYNLGDVSDDNFALIQVTPTYDYGYGHVWNFSDFVKIDGQGDRTMWKPSSWTPMANPKSIIRVTPGEYTFTITFTRVIGNALSGNNIYRDYPVSITYNVSAGKGYVFYFSTVTNNSSLSTSPFETIAVITINEVEIDEKGNLYPVYLNGPLPNKCKEVAKKMERFYVTINDVF